ncbi:serine hydrolase domain-containing protein [Deinococcus yavapaiensis]|nr:serine hydrolase domain-containing protein [Deinococcus yavapaiensis]
MTSTPGNASTEPFLDDLEALTRDLMTEHRVPGLALGLLRDDRPHVLCLGVTSVEHPLQVDEHTLFQIGSLTKTFTATAILRLVEQGRLDLDTPLRTYLPELRLKDESVAARVTLRHLLTHVAGWIGDFFEDTGNGDDALARYVDRMVTLEQITPLGEVWSYNNAAFCLAGRVLEVTTGQTYEQAVRTSLLRPLEMNESFFFPAEVMTRRFVVGHVKRDGDVRVARPWPIPRSNHPAGGLASSVTDLLKYARFQLGDGRSEAGERVLASETLRAMQHPESRAHLDWMMGLGWMFPKVGEERVIQHSGETNGQVSEFWVAPERGLAFALLTNAASGGALAQKVSEWVQQQLLGADPAVPEGRVVADEDLEAFAGAYDKLDDGASLDLAVQEGALVARFQPGVSFTGERVEAPPASTLQSCGDDRFVGVDGPGHGQVIEFLRDATGSVQYLRAGRVFVRRPS